MGFFRFKNLFKYLKKPNFLAAKKFTKIIEKVDRASVRFKSEVGALRK